MTPRYRRIAAKAARFAGMALVIGALEPHWLHYVVGIVGFAVFVAADLLEK